MRIIVLSLMLVAPEAFAKLGFHGVDGGGGVGVQCGQQVSTLDLYEARTAGLELLPSSGRLAGDLGKFGAVMSRYLSRTRLDAGDTPVVNGKLPALFQDLVSRFKDIRPGKRLPFSKDATLPALPSGCSFVQLAILEDRSSFPDDHAILRDLELWNRLSPMDQAALVIHEFIYTRSRENGEVTSDQTRKIVGLIFSRQSIEPIFAPVWDLPSKLVCSALPDDFDNIDGQESFYFYAHDDARNGRQGLTVTFEKFRTSYVSSRTTAFLPGASVKQILANGFRPGLQPVPVINPLLGESWDLELDFLEAVSPTVVSFRIRVTSPDDLFDVKPSIGHCQLERK